MTLARTLRRKPREIADALVEQMELGDAGVRAAEVAGAGFINFRLDPAFVARGLTTVLEADRAFGRAARGRASAWSSSSCRPTRPGRCTSATGGRPR
jgi:arginyl-tRNA synthetase